jgi:protein SCO1/2
MQRIDRRLLSQVFSVLLLCTSSAVGATSAPIGGDFRLTDQDGRPWSSEEARGKVVVMAFGYTFCPDICPTALATVAAAMTELGEKAEQIQPVFVSLDPQRDTPERLSGYVEWFHPRMIGLTGTPTQVDALADRYRVRYRVAREPGADYYTIDHSSSLYLLDRHGRLARMLPHGLPPAALVGALEQLLDAPAQAQRAQEPPAH